MSEIPPASKDDIHELRQRLDNTEIAIGLILAELSKQIDTKEVLEGALHRASPSFRASPSYPNQVTQILDKIKSSLITSLNL